MTYLSKWLGVKLGEVPRKLDSWRRKLLNNPTDQGGDTLRCWRISARQTPIFEHESGYEST